MSFRQLFAENNVNVAESAGSFSMLHVDVVILMLRYLPARDLARLMLVSKYFNMMTSETVPQYLGKPLLIDPQTNIPAKFPVVSQHLIRQSSMIKEYNHLKYKLKYNRHCQNPVISRFIPSATVSIFTLAAMTFYNNNLLALLLQLDLTAQIGVYAGGFSLGIFGAGLNAYILKNTGDFKRLNTLKSGIDGTLNKVK